MFCILFRSRSWTSPRCSCAVELSLTNFAKLVNHRVLFGVLRGHLCDVLEAVVDPQLVVLVQLRLPLHPLSLLVLCFVLHCVASYFCQVVRHRLVVEVVDRGGLDVEAPVQHHQLHRLHLRVYDFFVLRVDRFELVHDHLPHGVSDGADFGDQLEVRGGQEHRDERVELLGDGREGRLVFVQVELVEDAPHRQVEETVVDHVEVEVQLFEREELREHLGHASERLEEAVRDVSGEVHVDRPVRLGLRVFFDHAQVGRTGLQEVDRVHLGEGLPLELDALDAHDLLVDQVFHLHDRVDDLQGVVVQDEDVAGQLQVLAARLPVRRDDHVREQPVLRVGTQRFAREWFRDHSKIAEKIMSSKKWSLEEAASHMGYGQYINSDKNEVEEPTAKGGEGLTQWWSTKKSRKRAPQPNTRSMSLSPQVEVA